MNQWRGGTRVEPSKPIPVAKLIAYLEAEAGNARTTRHWWRAKVFEQAASLLRKMQPV